MLLGLLGGWRLPEGLAEIGVASQKWLEFVLVRLWGEITVAGGSEWKGDTNCGWLEFVFCCWRL